VGLLTFLREYKKLKMISNISWLFVFLLALVFIIFNYFIIKKIVGSILGGKKTSKPKLMGLVFLKLISYLAMVGIGVYFLTHAS